MRALVIGATGFIGGAAVRHLRERGDEVSVLVRDKSACAAFEAMGATAYVGSLGDLPLIVLAADQPPMPVSLPLPVRRRLIGIWHALQQDHARRSTSGELRVVRDCGHAIATDAPHAVIAAVQDSIGRIARRITKETV